MVTVNINLNVAAPVNAITVTAIQRNSGATVAVTPLALTNDGGGQNWSGSFTDSTPPSYYTVWASATLTNGDVIPFGNTFIIYPPTVPTIPLSKWSVMGPTPQTPVTISQVEYHLRIDSTLNGTEGNYIQQLICAATDYAQDAMNLFLMPQTVSAIFNAEDVSLSPPVNDYPWDPLSPLGTPLGTPSFATWGTYNRSPVINITRGPVQSIIAINDGSGAAIINYALERTPTGDRVRFMGTATYPVTVVYQAGYPSVGAIPAGIITAILCHVGTLYNNRESANAGGAKVVPHSLEAFYRLKARRIPCA